VPPQLGSRTSYRNTPVRCHGRAKVATTRQREMKIRCRGRKSHYGMQLFTGTLFVFYSPSGIIPRGSQDISRKEKAPSTFQSRTPRQPSPRTAKPRLNLKIRLIFCKRHFGNPTQGWMRADVYEDKERLGCQWWEDSLLRRFFSIASARSTRHCS